MSQDSNATGNVTPDIEQDSEQDLPEQIAVRLAKRERLNETGDAYPVSLPITHTIDGVRAAYPDLDTDVATGDKVALAGRIVFQRNTGKLCFATLQAGSGQRIQAMLSLDKVGEDRLEEWKELVDLGDHVFVAGEVITSKRGELSILADEWLMAAKTIRPLPNLHNELGEEYRVRHRYIDLIVRDRAREVVQIRSKVMQSLRRTFEQEAFLEVETPMLQTLHGGASARPFKTHSNAFDTELFLRIAPELWHELKGWAEQDMRSLNAQIELLLREAVRQRKNQRPASSKVSGSTKKAG